MPDLRIRRPKREPIEPRLSPSSGQSLVELALVLPVLLLLLVTAIDLGRVYLGWVNLQQMARVAGNFAAEHAHAWDTPNNAAVLLRYQQLVANDAAAINCDLPKDGGGTIHVPDPAFPAGFDIGDPVQIQMPCRFNILTPIISQVLGGSIPVSASVMYPVMEGAVAQVPGGGGPILLAPVADFIGTPQTGFGQTAAGYGALDVTFTDLSKKGPTSWQWDFGNGGSFTKGPHVRHYGCDKLPGETCTFTVKLTVGSGGGFDTATKIDYITVTVPPATGPIAEFTATPRSGLAPLNNVQLSFVNKTGTLVTYTKYEWDFEGNGTFVTAGATASHNYGTPGVYSVSLRVTDSTGATNVQTKAAYIVVIKKICTVPDFANQHKNTAQSMWNGAGFSTTVLFGAGNGNYTIHAQSLVGGTIDPQPNGCASVITVGP